jgi:hypothetical protein
MCFWEFDTRLCVPQPSTGKAVDDPVTFVEKGIQWRNEDGRIDQHCEILWDWINERDGCRINNIAAECLSHHATSKFETFAFCLPP